MTKTDTEITYGNSQWNEDQSVGERSKKILRNSINRHTFWDTRFKIEGE